MQSIKNYPQLKLISDPRRLAILRLLMHAPATLSQLGKMLGTHPAQVRHHLKQLEEAKFVKLEATRTVRGFVEKYYRATSKAFIINFAIIPEVPNRETILLMGSDDLALRWIAGQFAAQENVPTLINLPVGSLDGLIALRQGICHMTGCHLLDPDTGEYNYSYVQRLLPGRRISAVTLAHRQQGLILPSGNPKNIEGLEDLLRKDIKFVNRNKGSGTRLWLAHNLRDHNIPIRQIHGFDHEVDTHLHVAELVAKGDVDVGLGILAAADHFELGFIPLFEERYDIVIPTELTSEHQFSPLFEFLQTVEYRRAAQSLNGYSTKKAGNSFVVEP